MSQKKVDYYKQAKANRKREEKKKNLRKAFDYTILGLIALAIVVWIGWSAYDMYESKQPRAVAEVDYSAVSNYVQSLKKKVERWFHCGTVSPLFLCTVWRMEYKTLHFSPQNE